MKIKVEIQINVTNQNDSELSLTETTLALDNLSNYVLYSVHKAQDNTPDLIFLTENIEAKVESYV